MEVKHIYVAARKLCRPCVVNQNSEFRSLWDPLDEDVMLLNTEVSGLGQLNYLAGNGEIVLLTEGGATRNLCVVQRRWPPRAHHQSRRHSASVGRGDR